LTIRVLIVGGGISGLTLATALRREAINVDLVEIRRNLSQQTGVGLSLQGNCIAALARIGLAAECLKRGMPANHLNLRRADGTLIAHQPLLPMGGPAYPGTIGISRSDLHDILLAAAHKSGATIKLGTSFSSFHTDANGVDVGFTDGSQQRYDLLVGADGAYSATRATLFPTINPTSCGQSVWRAGVPRPKDNFTTELHLGGPFGVVGICPISSDSAYLYIVEAADLTVRYADEELVSVMTQKLEPYQGAMVRECVAKLPQSTAISYRPLEWLLVPAPWFQGRLLLVGDAAHCNPPVLAQGAAMGIEDAVVLAELLAEDSSIDTALAKFDARRFPRASLVVNNSVQLCEWEVKHLVGPQEVGRLILETQQALSHPF
jgi:2-polyprenyl-6-methoxyphenol hydroxylase-like FAD-dependent oxidoreductase